MADWYVSSAAWTAIAQFAASTAYTVGNVVRPLTAPATGHAHAFRCTTAGTSGAEPTWPTGNNSTVMTGGATFTNVTGQSTYGWSAAASDLYSISQAAGWNRPVAGDRVFLSSDHSETLNLATQTYSFNNGASNYGVIKLISVNRGGSVPPVPGDITPGATLNANDAAVINLNLEAYTDMYWEGVSVIVTSNVTAANFNFNSGSNKEHYFKNCSLQLNTTGTGRFSCANCAKVILDNTTIQFGATGQSIVPNSGYQFDFTWINTPSAIAGATVPSTLFTLGGSGSLNVVCRGVDLSAITGQLVGTGISAPAKVLFDSCRIASGVTRFPVTAGTTAVVGHEVDLINCYDGTNVIHERYTEAGAVTTDHSTYLTGGAADDVGNYSLKMASNANSDFTTLALNNFWFDVENTLTGASHMATVEIISSASLNNNDIRLLLEYMGTSGNPVASFVDSLATVLTATAALGSSSATWNSPPSTPQAQHLQVAFTPQRAGRVRGLVRLGKVSTTVWVNPQIAIT